MEDSSPFDLVQCPLCRTKLPPKKLQHHLIKLHLNGHSELLADVLKANALDPNGPAVKCIHCKSLVKRSRIPEHFWRVHGVLYGQPIVAKEPRSTRPKLPAGTPLNAVVDAQTGMANVVPGKFDELLRNLRLAARSVERCECRKVVVFVDLEPRVLKAFDVDRQGRLIGAHACDGPRSESIHAFNGGAVDSNRRKH